jgi:hypothetical protein
MNTNDPALGVVITLTADLKMSMTATFPFYVDVHQRQTGNVMSGQALFGFRQDSAFSTTVVGDSSVDLAQPKQILISL